MAVIADPRKADRPVMAAGNSVYGLRWASASAAGNCADKVERVGYTVRQRILLSRNSVLEAPVTTLVEVLAGGCASGSFSSDSSGK